MIKSNKGITLIALLVTIIIIIIVASIATYYGVKNIKATRFERLRSQIQTVQLKVNEMYEEYRSGSQSVDDELASIDSNNATWIAVTGNAKYSNINFGDINDYKKYYPSDIEKKLDISDFDETLLINIKNRRIIIENGYEYEGETFYIIEDFESLMYNTDYSGFKYEVFDDYPYSTIEISDVVFESNNVLPAGYTQLEYIESTGTQYIDTEYIPKNNTVLNVDFKTTKVAGEAFTSLFGTQKTTTQGRFYILFGTPNNNQSNLPRNTASYAGLNADGTFEKNTIKETSSYWNPSRVLYSADIKNKKIKIDNLEWDLSSYFTGSFVSPTYPLYILTRNTAGVADLNCSKGLLYGVEIYEDNTLVKNMIPCKNPYNEVGMYDIVEGKFYENKGTGDFIANLDSKVYYKKTNSETWIENTNSDNLIVKISEPGTYSVKVVSAEGKEIQHDNIKVNPTKDTANAPELTADMIPVVWDREKLNWVKADRDNTANSWYNYSKSENKWANVAIVSTNGTNSKAFYKSAEEGTEILMEDIQAMFVWIPRFDYIENEGEYTVKFSKGKKDLTSNSNLLSVFEEYENGIWVGKYECSQTDGNIQIKPNQNSINNIEFNDAISEVNNLRNTYNLTDTTSSIISDDAWTAVAILSKYATSNSNIYNNSYYEGFGNNTVRTGMASGEYNSVTSTNFQKTNKIENTGKITLKGFVNGNNTTYDYYEYWTDNGQKASTTQNVYGIYDMVGGYKEYVLKDTGSNAYTRGGTYNEYKDILNDNDAVSGEDLTATYRAMLTMSNKYNLIRNGDLKLANNDNFSGFTYKVDSEGKGFLTRYIKSNLVTVNNSDYIQIDKSKKYKFLCDFKLDNLKTKYYLGYIEYDIDKKQIKPEHFLYTDNTLTTLTEDLKNGDTEVHLSDISNFLCSENTPSHQLGFIFWNYKDSKGHSYEFETEPYSQNAWKDLYSYSGVNKETNTITLKSAWNNGTFPAGTKLCQSKSGAIYKYSFGAEMTASDSEWKTYSAEIGGVGIGSKRFSPGTYYIRWMGYFNNIKDSSYYTNIYIRNLILEELSE